MKKNGTYTDAFIKAVTEAAESLRKRDIPASRALIADALVADMDAPHPHNLLGILCELSGDDNAARKHYRAAYALDPTYKPACRNLERLVFFEWGPQNRDYDFGIDTGSAVGKQVHS
jgi:tetratricopeptide (TPR) repeat protein